MSAPSSAAGHSVVAARSQADRCPGLLRPHRAADGALVRLRLPGGVTTVSALARVSAAARRFGDGLVQLTSRGNLQLRGIPVSSAGEVPGELIEDMSAAGLLPSASHELARNIICSPLTGRVGGVADLGPLTAELDAVLCRTPELARLPGRFLFALDDGRGDITPLGGDLGVRALAADRVELLAGDAVGPVVGIGTAAGHLTALARRFLRHRGDGPTAAWHVRELPGGGPTLLAGWPMPVPATEPHPPAPLRYGVLRQDDGRSLLSTVVPLGLLTADQVDAVVATAGPAGRLIVTPWRGLVVPDLDPGLDVNAVAARLAAVGLSLDAGSGWPLVSACAGAPGCARAAAPTRPIAALIAETRCGASSSTRGPAALPVHVVACERRCGSPAAEHIEVLVGGGGPSGDGRGGDGLSGDGPGGEGPGGERFRIALRLSPAGRPDPVGSEVVGRSSVPAAVTDLGGRRR